MFAKRLSYLREGMKARGLDAYLQPLTDSHLSEYVTDHDQVIAYLTGFKGSAGYLVITQDKARLFVDQRYTVQAKEELDASLFELGEMAGNKPILYAIEAVGSQGVIGLDPSLSSVTAFHNLQKITAQKSVKLAYEFANLIDEIWHDRPPQPSEKIFVHPLTHAGESRESKLEKLRKALSEQSADVLMLNKLESIAWLLNLRGRDLANTPLFQATALVDNTNVCIFIDPDKVSDDIRQELPNWCDFARPDAWLSTLQTSGQSQRRHLIDPSMINASIYQTLKKAGANLILGKDPIPLMQAVKNHAECDGIRKAHIRDGQAVCRFLYWLTVTRKDDLPKEGEAAAYIDGLRAKNDLFVCPSFPTISAYGPSAALPHYHHDETGGRSLKDGNLYLFDSGGQYHDGTTDITRTIVLGQANATQKKHYTYVLKGLIALSRVRFPEGVYGSQLDTLARQYLWQAGLDFGHGTGHGVGAFLNVHEGPNRISPRSGDVALIPGMIQSNEPGFYYEGHYGIRLENLILTQTCADVAADEASQKPLLEFETLTFAPFDRNLIDIEQLDLSEREWLNAYHAKVFAKLHEGLEPQVLSWLHEATQPLIPPT